MKTKEDIFRYITNRHSKGNKVILIRGSTAYKKIKNFSDIDVEIWGKKKKPIYEIVKVGNKLILISIYFYEYKKGKKANPPENVKVIYGEYVNSIKPDFSKDTYTSKQKIIRETQMAIDFLFMYLRHGIKRHLDKVNKKLK